MAALCRCVVYLVICVVLLSLITGGQCQCGTGTNGKLRLRAGLTPANIWSPGYPESYPDNVRCRWQLFADYGYVIHVHVAWIQMEVSYQCGYDNLTFYDGQTTYHRKMGTICTTQMRDFYSSSRHMFIQFLSDFTVSDDGFQLEYSAIKYSDVPTTVAAPWPFPGDTTTRTTTTTTTTTTTSSDFFRWPSYSVVALIGGVAGGLVLLFVVFALARYYVGRHYSGNRRRRQTARPYPPHSTPPLPPTAPSGTIYQNNNAVFMVSSSTTTSHPYNPHTSSSSSTASAPYGGGGVTNLAFSPFREAPPAYFAVQQSTTVMQPGSGGAAGGVGPTFGIPPPSYTEAMRVSQPPPAPHPPVCNPYPHHHYRPSPSAGQTNVSTTSPVTAVAADAPSSVVSSSVESAQR